jgi:hypothetical protein
MRGGRLRRRGGCLLGLGLGGDDRRRGEGERCICTVRSKEAVIIN